MAVVLDDPYGPKPALTMLGGSPAMLPVGSVPFQPASRALTLSGGRTVSYVHIYSTQPWIATAIRRMAEAIARLPLQLFGFADPSGDTRYRDRRHNAAQLLNRPRPRQRGFHLRWDIALSTYVHGNYVGWKRRRAPGLPPFELWTLDWRYLIPLMAGQGQRVLGWRWLGDGIPGLETGQTILIEDTLHIAFNGPGGGDLGISPLAQLDVTVRSEDAIQRLSEANFRNGTRFGVAVILDPKAKADAVIRAGVREELQDAHGGVDQAYRPAILGGGVTDLKPLHAQTAAEAELITQRKLNREEAAAVIGIPQPLAGILDDANYSSLAELHRILYVTSLGGPLGLIGESIQAQLLDAEAVWDRDERFVEFSLDDVLKGDAKQRWETYAVALDHGGLTLNDVRRKENLPPYDDPRADEPLIAANNVRPLSAVGIAGTNVVDGNPIATATRELAAIVGDAQARAREGAAEDFDRAELERALADELQARVGLNGASDLVAAHFAEAIERDVLTDPGEHR